MQTSLLTSRHLLDQYAHFEGRTILAGEFIADILVCAETLPNARYVINLCEDRYRFNVVFFASLVRGQITLLTSKRDIEDVEIIKREYSGCVIISDRNDLAIDHVISIQPGMSGSESSPAIDADLIAAIAFTSGSTGQPKAHLKSWEMLCHWRLVHSRYFPDSAKQRGLVATVPPWHMYGLEWALLLPSISPLTLYCGPTFFPEDVVTALDQYQVDTVLVSTPVHLRALLKSPAPARSIDLTVSATAPLEVSTVKQIEQYFSTQLLEIYGCSEIGSLARRFPAKNTSWEFFDCFETSLENNAMTIDHSLLPCSVLLADHFSKDELGNFTLLGRATDVVKVAGKRNSLANLNQILLGMPGVKDGFYYRPDDFGLVASERLAAIVVAPTLTAKEIKTWLSSKVDSVFVPRPVNLVESIPRESTSKLTKQKMKILVDEVHKN